MEHGEITVVSGRGVQVNPTTKQEIQLWLSHYETIANADEGTHKFCGESTKHPQKQTGEPVQSYKGKN